MDKFGSPQEGVNHVLRLLRDALVYDPEDFLIFLGIMTFFLVLFVLGARTVKRHGGTFIPFAFKRISPIAETTDDSVVEAGLIPLGLEAGERKILRDVIHFLRLDEFKSRRFLESENFFSEKMDEYLDFLMEEGKTSEFYDVIKAKPAIARKLFNASA